MEKRKKLDIVDLEISNLSQEQKQELLKSLSSQDKHESRRLVIKTSDNGETEYYYKKYMDVVFAHRNRYTNNLDDVLKIYFTSYVDDFIDFQKKYKNSLYNQAIKKQRFKDFNYEDMVKSLTSEQKHEITKSSGDFGTGWLAAEKEKEGVDAASLKQVKLEDKKEIEAFLKIDNQAKRDKYKFKSKLPDLRQNIDNYLKNEFAIAYRDANSQLYIEYKFFKNQDELILFGLNNQFSAPGLLKMYKEWLDPHYKVNNFIEKNYKFDFAKKIV